VTGATTVFPACPSSVTSFLSFRPGMGAPERSQAKVKGGCESPRKLLRRRAAHEKPPSWR
jgi:hypothetical protein